VTGRKTQHPTKRFATGTQIEEKRGGIVNGSGNDGKQERNPEVENGLGKKKGASDCT